MTEAFSFHVTGTDGRARSGEMRTAHGFVRTPAFVPVGTSGAVKGITHRDLRATGAEIVLANTYHLFLRPGDELIARCGGLHRFMAWPGPILTDSGGYQVFSFGPRRTVSEEGVRFRSHLDGTEHLLTPERSIDIQARLGADIAMAFDECTSYPVTEGQARRSMELSVRWARRSRTRFLALETGSDRAIVTNPGQVQFGIVQGGMFPQLREASAAATVEIGFEAYAIGGLSVGESTDEMYEIGGQTAERLPNDQLRYLMGLGCQTTSLRWSLTALISLIACCRHAMGGTTSSLPERVQSISRPLGMLRTWNLRIPNATVTLASNFHVHIFGTFSWRMN